MIRQPLLAAGLACSLAAAAGLAVRGGAASAQTAAPSSARELTILSREGRERVPIVAVSGREMVALADLAPIFDLDAREDSLAGGLVITHRGRTIVLSAGEGLASVGGRVVSLPAPPVRQGDRWLVPLEFISLALARVHEPPIDLRRAARLVVVGDLRVPRVEIEAEPLGDQLRLAVELTPATGYTIRQQDRRLVIRFDADAVDLRAPAEIPGDLVRAIGPVEAPATVVVELGPRFGAYRSSALAGDRSGLVLIDVLPAADTAARGTPAAPEPAPPPLPELTPVSALRTVVIDPGHGGDEEGARGPGGTLEKDVTLAVARRLKSAIENRLGLRVLLTREADTTVRLDERAAIANNNKADLFISLHANASVRASAAGAEVFYLSIDEYGAEARRLAAAEGQTLPVVGGGTRDIEIILWEMAQVRHLEQSGDFAKIVEQELRERLDMSPRAIQQAPFRVLVGANMPAVLVEMGFISNPDEEARLTSEAFQTAVAEGLVESVVRFRDYVQSRRASAPARVLPPEGDR